MGLCVAKCLVYEGLKVHPDVAVAIRSCHVHGHTQKVLLYSKFMFNSKATPNGNRYVREHL